MKPLRLAVVTSMVLVPARALADEPALSERDRNVARESVYQGDDLVKRGDTRGALEAYRRANAIMKVPTTGIEVARTSLRLGLLVEALEASRQTAAYPQNPGEPAPFTKAREEARALMESLKTRIPKLTVAVLAPEGVKPQVVLDDTAIAETVLVPVNPGTHRISASAPNLVSAQAEVELTEGEKRRVELVLKAPVGVKVVTTEGPATYWPLVYTGLALTVAGVAGGTATGVLSLDAAKELRERCDSGGACPAGQGLEDVIDRRNTLGYVSTGAFALAGVGVALAIPSLVVSLRRRSEASSVSVAPLFDMAGQPTVGGTLTLW